MAILVANCFHWIGYHIVDYFLNCNERVDGIDPLDSEAKEYLSMFFVRNDKFHLISENEIAKYDSIIKIGTYYFQQDIPNGKMIMIDEQHKDERTHVDEIIIDIPLIYGEWMPMDEESCYFNGKKILFDSKQFREEAIYIKDFVSRLHEWIHEPALPSTLFVRSEKVQQNEHIKLENSISIRDNRPIDKTVKELLEHYHKHREFYPPISN